MLSRFVLSIVVTGLLAGCATGPPTVKERYDVQSGKKNVVLLRVTCELENGTPVEAFPQSLGDPVVIAKGGPITGGKVDVVRYRFLSPETRKQGWVFFYLKPGIHYLIFQGTSAGTRLFYSPRFKVNISKEHPVVYIGTMHLCCVSTWNFGMKYCAAVDSKRMVVSNEEIQAKKLLKEYLSNFGSLQTILMKRS